jgi:hypothetical protein
MIWCPAFFLFLPLISIFEFNQILRGPLAQTAVVFHGDEGAIEKQGPD